MDVIKLNEVYKPNRDYKVIVKTITFNHSRYIEDTLNGIAMQTTSFPFVNVVLEDNSTDGTQNVIKIWLEQECDLSVAKYYDIPTADVIIAPHRTNTNCTFAIYFHKENLFQQKIKREEQVNPWRTKSEYEALCEGDDYWIDPLKLQKQIDFLDANPNYGLCHTNYKCYIQSSQIIETNKIKKDSKNEDTASLLRQNTIATLTTCYRSDLYQKIPQYYASEKFKMGDYPLWIELSSITKIKYLSDVTSIYRFLENSASHSSDCRTQLQFNIDAVRVRMFYAAKYNYIRAYKIAQRESLYWNSLLMAVNYNKISSIKLFLQSMRFGLKDTLRFLKYIIIG